jgi:PAS domain S-box-containing protein
MDVTSVLIKTPKGIVQPKSGDGNLNYDAVRVLRLVDGKSSIAQLRPQFTDLTDTRFQKAIQTLEEKKLVQLVSAQEANSAENTELRKLDAKVQDIAQEVVQTLDFTKLERGMLAAAIAAPPPAAAGKAPTAVGTKPPTPAAPAETDSKIKVKLAAELRPKVEMEVRTQLAAELRPKIEEELRGKLIAVLRPVLEAEIRSKLAIALEPRVALELRNQMKNQSAQAPDASTAAASTQYLRLLECMRETVFQTDLAGTSIYLNERWTKISGFSCEETVGKPLAQFFVPEDQGAVAEHIDKVARGDSSVPLILEARLARKGGEPLKIAMRAAPLSAASGPTVGVCGTLRGMT